MIEVSPTLSIPENEVTVSFIRASGPGGQNVNKVATAAQLRFDVANSPTLSDDLKTRLIKLAGKRMTADGILVIEAKRFRTQERNRDDAVERLIKLIRRAAQKPKKRRKTKPTAASRERRLQQKGRRSQIKYLRRSPRTDD